VLLQLLQKDIKWSLRGIYWRHWPRDSGVLVFCKSVRGPLGCYAVYMWLRERLGSEVGFFCGERPAEFPGHEQAFKQWKEATMEQFMQGQKKLLVVTSAFGMGVNKSNVRKVFHLERPDSALDYEQESGRAGRDRQRAECILLDDLDDPTRSREQPTLSTTQNKEEVDLSMVRLLEQKGIWLELPLWVPTEKIQHQLGQGILEGKIRGYTLKSKQETMFLRIWKDFKPSNSPTNSY
jgi:superfamily II DNA helicase RecQ